MKKIRNAKRGLGGLGALSLLAALATGAQGITSIVGAADRAGSSPVVVELFTSQSCYSCPPAERLLGTLADEPGILALEFHVDYWDDLVYGSAGRWKDVFSKSAYTERQRDYNSRIRRTRSVYTPQMIVDGVDEMVGSKSGAVRDAISRAKRRANPVQVSIVPENDGGFSVEIAPAAGGAKRADVWFVRFIKKQVTEVRAGENKGKSLANHHVVTDIRRLDRWNGGSQRMALDVPSLGTGESCAILLQDDMPGPVLGAAHCPDFGAQS